MATKRKRWPRKPPYNEGDFFSLPLPGGGRGVGLVARMDGSGGIFGYLFGPRRDKDPEVSELAGLRPEEAVLLAQFGDLGILEQEWKVLGPMPNWDRARWPLTPFKRIDVINPRIALRVEYSDKLEEIRNIRCSPEEVASLPGDSLYGYKALEMELDERLPR